MKTWPSRNCYRATTAMLELTAIPPLAPLMPEASSPWRVPPKMRPRHSPSREPLSKPTGIANRLRPCCRSATRPCSTRSVSTESQKPRVTTDSQQAPDFLLQKLKPTASTVGFLTSSGLRNHQAHRLALRVAPRGRRNGNRVIAGWCSAHRRLGRGMAAGRNQGQGTKHHAEHQCARKTPPTTVP